MSVVVLVLVLALIVGVVVWVSHAAGRPGKEGPAPGGEATLRRLFLYALLLTTALVVAIGASGLLQELFSRSLIRDDAVAVARDLAFIVVGAPVYWLLWSSISRRLRTSEEERGAIGWGLYVGGAQLVAMVVTMTAAAELGTVAWEGGGSVLSELGRLVVWASVWGWHWYLLRSEALSPRMLSRLPLYLGSAAGLLPFAFGTGALLTRLGDDAYQRLFRDYVLVAGASPIPRAVSWAVIGALAWWWYWIRHARDLERSAAWHTYTLLLGVAGALAAALAAAGGALYLGLIWLFARPVEGAASHFGDIPSQLAVGLVGLVVWAYHRSLVAGSREVFATEPGRAYRYLVSAAGLLAAGAGVATVLTALLQALRRPLAGGGPLDTLLAGVTLLVVGIPVWWPTWRRIQAGVSRNPTQEVHSGVRRIYLVALFGAGGVVALVTLIIIAYSLFQILLGGDPFGDFADRSATALGLLAATGAVAGYHWTIWRADHILAPATPRHGPRSVLLVAGENADRIAGALRADTGTHVTVWHRIGDGDGSLGLAEAARTLATLEGERVVVVEEGDRLRILRYRP